MAKFALGFDIGSSSIKASLIDIDKNHVVSHAKFPEQEMVIHAEQPGFAEQDPEVWWSYVCQCSQSIIAQANINVNEVKAIGISYQMHGLVMVDEQLEPLRNSIIWCDSRAVDIGAKAFQELGSTQTLQRLLNSPGNFTASKLRWVVEHQKEIYDRCRYIMLPGDYIAMKMSGEVQTTISGLSEGTLWDFQAHKPASDLMSYYEISSDLIPSLVPSVGHQSTLSEDGAKKLGLAPGTPISYRAGDQPNNAVSLNVLSPGEIAGTGGTSGVVYAVNDSLDCDPLSRVNYFAHVNHQQESPRIGVLLCINATGIMYSWLRKVLYNQNISYPEMEGLANQSPVGANGIIMFPFGNGAERMLGNQLVGCQIKHIDLNRHNNSDILRAALEGIAFAFCYGMEIMQENGVQLNQLRVGNDNLFQSGVFAQTLANITSCPIQVVATTGSEGAARAASIGSGLFSSYQEAFATLDIRDTIHPKVDHQQLQKELYLSWKNQLNSLLKS